MKRIIIAATLIVTILITWFIINKTRINTELRILYPWNGAVLPADIAPPNIKWLDKHGTSNRYIISATHGVNKTLFTREVTGKSWKPNKNLWDSIKIASNYKPLKLKLIRTNDKASLFKQKALRPIIISADSVNAPILYREIPLPFSFAEENMDMASYSLYNLADTNPKHTVLEKFDVCGNCHSLSDNGRTIALDFDASTRDKGGYFIADIDTITEFNQDNYLSWSSFQKESTFGLFSKISNNGRYVVTTIKDRVISKKIDPKTEADLAYSQVFFPVNGVLAVYDRYTKTLNELPGANDTAYVQSNAIWTPDDKHIIFARARAIPYPDTNVMYKSFIDDKVLIEAFVRGEKQMKFDLYMVPFNKGKGGKATPIKGASNNEMSNYFPAISPNGDWLAYCQADNLMMLRPDSKIHMVSMKTGKSKALKSNFNSMNSWHAWSPNGKWLTFTSKPLSVYTDLFLTHIDEKGNASVPVLLEGAHTQTRAVNYPEFINTAPDYKFTMNYNYVNIKHIADIIENKNDTIKAYELIDQFLSQKENFTPEEYEGISMIYSLLGNISKSKYFKKISEEYGKDYYKIKNK